MNNSKPIVRDLNIEPEKLQQVNELLKNYQSAHFKKNQIRNILGFTFCAECHGIPEIEVVYAEYGIKRIEHWCRSCYQVSLERTSKEPETREEIAAFYNCEIAPEGTFGGSKKGYEQ